MSRQKHCHWRIAKVAKEIAACEYEEMARDNVFFAQWPKRRAFIQANWGLYIDPARQALTGLLNQPGFPDAMKEEIYEALMLDGVFNPRVFTSLAQAEQVTGERLSLPSPSAMTH